MADKDRRSQGEIDEERRNEERRTKRRSESRPSEFTASRPEGRRPRGRDQGAWPYAGPMGTGHPAGVVPGPGMGYPGYMSYPWSRFSHGMDPSYEDWQGPGFGTQTPGSWEPRVETYERDDRMVVRLELPGWDKDEVSVAVEDDELVVEGLRQENGDSDEDRRSGEVKREFRRYRAERFCTRIPLATTTDAADVKAKFKNGILEVRVPMPERRSERRTVTIDT